MCQSGWYSGSISHLTAWCAHPFCAMQQAEIWNLLLGRSSWSVAVCSSCEPLMLQTLHTHLQTPCVNTAALDRRCAPAGAASLAARREARRCRRAVSMRAAGSAPGSPKPCARGTRPGPTGHTPVSFLPGPRQYSGAASVDCLEISGQPDCGTWAAQPS